jgi:hypothetical protein
LNTSLFNSIITTCRAGGGGNIRSVPNANRSEASVGFHNYTDLTASAAGDMIVAGMNCWVRSGYSIGTPVKQTCLTITNAGEVLIPYNLIVSTDTHLSGNLTITSING